MQSSTAGAAMGTAPTACRVPTPKPKLHPDRAAAARGQLSRPRLISAIAKEALRSAL
jgi:hypothetical protein